MPNLPARLRRLGARMWSQTTLLRLQCVYFIVTLSILLAAVYAEDMRLVERHGLAGTACLFLLFLPIVAFPVWHVFVHRFSRWLAIWRSYFEFAVFFVLVIVAIPSIHWLICYKRPDPPGMKMIRLTGTTIGDALFVLQCNSMVFFPAIVVVTVISVLLMLRFDRIRTSQPVDNAELP